MFGTLYVTQSKPETLQFGTGDQDVERYLTLRGLILTPFIDIAHQILSRKRSAVAILDIERSQR
ncbi:hypothetical protein D3C72_2529490 [compost metagenome]